MEFKIMLAPMSTIANIGVGQQVNCNCRQLYWLFRPDWASSVQCSGANILISPATPKDRNGR